MADEAPQEASEFSEDKLDEYGEEGEEVFAGEELSLISEKTLKSDFCPSKEFSGEEYGELQWVCEEYPGEREYYGEIMPEGGYGALEEEEKLSLEERRTLDSEYLKSVLGTPLTFALMEIATKRPSDPIQFLGHYLLKWRWAGEDKAKYEEKMKELDAEREAYLEKQREKERQEMLEKEEKEEELRRAERVESSMENDDLGEGQELVE